MKIQTAASEQGELEVEVIRSAKRGVERVPSAALVPGDIVVVR